ncbi:E3 ubiquitin-protein ligase LRSAM1 isoform X1 [Agrilus planipennis]|uniref:E3 ubiquitin-protein ligase LRSAM1 isoform X1 n=2 Tax=Agrilus planipennis TaxID=224129 RepID=A0A7F5RLU3_AGRPL|nr:E3 ubiquitin-protein ligase LRSAM1 isoform X1 [Agrilus planipennis]
MFKKNKKDKAKLEHKLYLARETPELVFDISECDLKAVPPGIYSLCKVFLKEKLELQKNSLTSLNGGGNLSDLCTLKVLNVSYNALTFLPNEIDQLTNLQELYVNDNHLKQLPSTICHLKYLQIFDVSTNKLKNLPENLGSMVSLQEINLKNNPKLHELPKSISCLHNMQCIQIDITGFTYPPEEIVKNGTSSIMKFICEDMGQVYVSQNEPTELERSNSNKSIPRSLSNSIKASILDYENNKRKKMVEFLEIEKHRSILQRQEYDLAQSVKVEKERLLSDIAEQQNELDNKLLKLQQEREKERFRLIEQLQEVEDKANVAVNQLLLLNRQPLTKLLEQEKLEEQRLMEVAGKQYDNLEKIKILADMEEVLYQESEKFKKFGEFRIQMAKNVLNDEMELDKHLVDVLSNQDLQKTELISKLEEDTLLQKAAVSTLLERSDARSWALRQEMRLVEGQLAALTAIELDRKRLKMDEHLYDLAEKRENLSYVLLKLYEEQNQRRAELLSALNNVEEFSNTSENFWLQQYQRLLERMPNNLSETQKNVNQRLAQRLLLAGVIQYLPMLCKIIQDEDMLRRVTEKDIIEAGVVNPNHCLKIYEELRLYVDSYLCGRSTEPSAPSAEEAAGPSAPPLNIFPETGLGECIVCMEFKCETIFVPCGHYCCCTNCSNVISACPLCRTSIKHKVYNIN